jgi:hypothetical protein
MFRIGCFLSEWEEGVAYFYALGNEEVLILFVHQSIMINSHVFMIPEMDEGLSRLNSLGISCADTLNHFPNIPQVKSVMRFGWSW